jgi:tetratricopeptide (TPR) repeat protein
LTEITTTSSEKWTSAQAFGIALVCLLLGVAGGWFIKKSLAPATQAAVAMVPEAASSPAGAMPATLPTGPAPQEVQQTAETEVAPLLLQLKSDPSNADLLASIGNIYYDAQQYPTAIEYYQRCLKIQPFNAGVRTDMATAIWYSGNADGAITEFNQSLSYEPTKANTLFNLGIVLWQGKHDSASAIATWEKLLAANPNYENKAKVQQLIAEAKK